MTTRTLSAVGLFLLCSFSSAHAAQESIGSAVKVVNLVTAEWNRDTRSLQDGDKVHQDENIEVGTDASSEFKLDDDTKLALGPGARLRLDKFVYDPAKTSGSIVLNLVKGTFRFITGVASKPTYVLRTPAAAITVRGTIFDVYIQQDDTVWLLLHEGAIQVCNDRGKCQLLDEPGKLMRVTSDGGVGSPVKWASLPGKDSVPFDKAFPFVVNAPSIDPNPIFTRDIIILGTYPGRDKGDKDDKGDRGGKGKDRGDDSKPNKKAEKKEPTKKKTRTAKKNSSDDDNIVSGMDIVIGGGIGIGRGRGGYPGKGGMPGRGGGGDYGGGGGGKYPGGGGMPRGGGIR
jgi:hypothetical protein